MRRSLAVVLALAMLPVAAVRAAAQEPDLRPGVAVFPFEDGGWTGMTADDRSAMSVGLQQILLNELSQNANLRIVERNILRQILEEQDQGTSGRVDAATAARIGKVVGARYVVLGTFTDLAGSQPTVTGRIVSVETSEVLKAEQSLGKKDELYQMLVDLAGRVTTGVELPALPSEQREARRSRAIPPEALRLYFRAQNLQDLGRTQQAIDLYQQISQKFPAMSEAQEALRQLQG